VVSTLGSNAATMTRMVQHLEHAGFVRRKPDADDKRVTIVELTAAVPASAARAPWVELD
jgi:MarR family transcriptional regulator, organic hydroperoxide resistance regulator